MRFLRALLLVVVLLPSIGLAAPCCAEPVADACCGPMGDCPVEPSGACVLTAAAAPCVSASAPFLESPTSQRVHSLLLSSLPGLRDRAAPPPDRAESLPLQRRLHPLRI